MRSVPFTAIFSGNDFTINNLIINRPSEDDVGLFGRVSAAVELQNVRLEEVNVSREFSCWRLGGEWRGPRLSLPLP